jgi:hypothetical protein
VFDDGSGDPWTTGTNSFSRSAIGHRAFVATLRKLGVPVEISRFRTLDKVGSSNLLLLLEPDLVAGKELLSELDSVGHVLLVLPKWVGSTDPAKPIWINHMEPLPVEDVQKVLRATLPDGEVIRKSRTVTYDAQKFGGKLSISDPQFLNTLGDVPVQPLLKIPDGVLLAELRGRNNEVWVLSDPDLLSNAGLDDADNGVIAVSIVEALLPPGGTVVIDETSHGFEQRPNLLRLLLHPPFIAIGIAGIAALLIVIWAGAPRFGAPQAETVGLAAGKVTLVRNAAQLLRLGTTAANLLQSYRRLVLSEAIAELHGPPGLDELGQAAWLDRAAQHRGLKIRLTPLLNDIATAEAGHLDAARALRFTLELHRWKQEIMHGNLTAGTR